MQLKGKSALRFANRPAPDCRLALIFGDDEGIVSDTAAALIDSWTEDTPSNVRTLDDDAIKKEPGLLFDLMAAQSLLGDSQIIRIRTRGEKLFPVLKDLLDIARETPERLAARLVVLCDALKKRSKLRTAFETSGSAAALHVYSDSAQDMRAHIQGRLANDAITIEADALSLFAASLPGQRAIANAEIEKLALFAYDLGRPVNSQDILAICQTEVEEDGALAVRLALQGDIQAAQAELDRVIENDLKPINMIRLFEREADRMIKAHDMLARKEPRDKIGLKLFPQVWPTDWPVFAETLSKWPIARLIRLSERLYELEALCKASGGASEAAIRSAFIDFYKAAAAKGG